MKLPTKGQLERMRMFYPAGQRVRLDSMDDRHAPPKGTMGTIIDVDDMGTIHVAWDNGSTLGLIYGEDQFHRVFSEGVTS